MKRVLRTAALIIGLAPAVMVSCARKPPVPREPPRDWARPLRAIELASSPGRIARGRYLTSALLRCSQCHGDPDLTQSGEPSLPGREFVGRIQWDDSTGRVVAPNLTPDRETGIGRWTDDMLLRAMREGVGHDGRALHHYMPYRNLRFLSDEDAASIVVFLRSLPPVRHALPATFLPESRKREFESELVPLTEPVPMPDTTDAAKRGRYFILVADCAGCHTSWYTDYNPGLFAGGNEISRVREGRERKVFSLNITPDSSGIGGLDSTGLVALMRSGRGGSMDPVMPWAWYANLSDRDLGAVLRGLRTVHPALHWISNGPPTLCAICGQTHGMGERNHRVRPKGMRLSTDALERLTGTYTSRQEDWTLMIAREGTRLYAVDDGTRFELVPVAEDRCLAPGLTSPVHFERDSLGRALAVVMEDIPPLRFERVAVP